MISRNGIKAFVIFIFFVFICLGSMILLYRFDWGWWPGNAPHVCQQKDSADEILPIEDLMREHGVLNRLLLIYEEIIKRAEKKEQFPKEVLGKALTLVRSFIEDYHEKLEETYIFPLFLKQNKEVELVNTLLAQHTAGRRVTDELQKLVREEKLNVSRITELMKKFITMYRPHEAREDTELFPKVHDLVTAQQFKELGEKFEDREKELFGEKGFEHIVEQVAVLEKELGIYELERFTPKT